jgi:hypothetical protein
MAKVEIGDILGGRSFHGWLNSNGSAKRERIAKIMIHRALLRTVPVLGVNGLRKSKQIPRWFLYSIRTLLLSRILCGDKNTKITIHDRNLIDPTFAQSKSFVFSKILELGQVANSQLFEPQHIVEIATEVLEMAANLNANVKMEYGRIEWWHQVQNDLDLVVSNSNPMNILWAPVWPDPPNWWSRGFQNLSDAIYSDLNDLEHWKIWGDWLTNCLQGKSAFDLSPEANFALERRIALGDGRVNFWDREPGEINREIARWIDEAKKPEHAVLLDHTDYKSRPASVETAVRNGVVVLAHDEPLSDLGANTAKAAAADLAQGLKQLASEAASAQADRRIVDFLLKAADTIEQAVHDQTKLFESGRNQKALDRYSDTVDSEWSPILGAQYHGLVVQFAQVLNHFEAWREFIAKPVVAAVPIAPAELAANVEEIYDELIKVKAAFADVVLVKLKNLTNSFQQAVNRWQIDDPSSPINAQIIEAMQSDLAVSVSNVLLSLAQWGFEHYGVFAVGGIGGALVAGRNKVGSFASDFIKGAILGKLQKSYPELYGTIVRSFKALKKFENDTK